jgi:predicted enzyme related to lactoylglutathione lyase
MVFYVANIDAALQRVKAAGGTILKPPFVFPGG